MVTRFSDYCGLFEITADGVFLKEMPLTIVTPVYIEFENTIGSLCSQEEAKLTYAGGACQQRNCFSYACTYP
jgi:hypothetical protein